MKTTTPHAASFLPKVRRLLVALACQGFCSLCVAGPPAGELQAESQSRIGGASIIADPEASGGQLVALANEGEGIELSHLPAAGKIAIRYASVSVGTISMRVGEQEIRKVNVHSSGALTGSFLHAVISLDLPAGGTVRVSRGKNDVAVNLDWVRVGKGDLGLPPDIWNLPPLEVAQGPFQADWEQLARNYQAPPWWREAKLGAWSHWSPQSMPEMGDWYARFMYSSGRRGLVQHHLKTYGHPSEYGYKDICNDWKIDLWDPESLMDLYIEMGAKYFLAMGVHHDNFDNWDSKYQPWNSVQVGPKTDIVGTWEQVARRKGMRFGIGFHHSPSRTWGQFMPVYYEELPEVGGFSDGRHTILDGKGKWWEGMDPVDLYGPADTPEREQGPQEKHPRDSRFANQFMWRVDDAISKYKPDMIYFDELAGSNKKDLDVWMGLGHLAEPLVANFYNKSLAWKKGPIDVVINLKGIGGRGNSFRGSEHLVPIVERSLVKSSEHHIEPDIMPYPFQTETTTGQWHYRRNQGYYPAKKLVTLLIENNCRNGTMLLNLSQRGRGNLDDELIQTAQDLGSWIRQNQAAIYGSRPFEVYGEEPGENEDAANARYLRNNGDLFAVIFNWNKAPMTLKALGTGSHTLGKVTKVEMLGSDVKWEAVQNAEGLTLTPNGEVEPLKEIADEELASEVRVFRIRHDKGWFNDDDTGASYLGWKRVANLTSGDYNHDLTISDRPGQVWSAKVTGGNIEVICPREPGAGNIEVFVDGQSVGEVNLASETRIAQAPVLKTENLGGGEHEISIVHRRGGPVAIDAIYARPSR